MKNYLLVLFLIFSLAFMPTVSFAKKDVSDTNNQVKNEQIKKSKEQIKAQKTKAKLEKKAQKAELKAKKLAEKTVLEQQKADEKFNKKNNSSKKVSEKKEIKNEVKVENKKTTEVKNKSSKDNKVEVKKDEKATLKVQDKKVPKKEIQVQQTVDVKVVAPVKAEKKVDNKKSDVVIYNKEIKTFFEKFADLQNKHNIYAIKKLYADNFVNTDGYNKAQLFDLMKKTFKSFPDFKATYEVKQITANDNFAMVYVRENIKATTKAESAITGDIGEYSAVLDDIFYLKKIANEWQIYSEDVVYESSVLAHGMAKGVKAELSAPQKVLCNQEYTAAVSVDVPDGYSAIASINSTQIVDGYNMEGEKFRQLSSDTSSLERVLKANNERNNEAVVVSVGFTKITQDIFKKPKIDISGLMILMKRVDIIPANSNYKVAKDKKSVEE